MGALDRHELVVIRRRSVGMSLGADAALCDRAWSAVTPHAMDRHVCVRAFS